MRKLALVSIAAAVAALPAAAAAQPRVAYGGQPHAGAGAGGQVHHRGAVPHRRLGDVRRFRRGHVVPQAWMGPRFHVRHWQTYGFPAPRPGWRWVRYYDDALLLDRRGRVMDGRYGFDWDRYDDRWAYDERGTPYYADDGYAGYDEYGDGGYDGERYGRRGDRRGHHRGGGWDYSEYGRCECGPGPGYPPPAYPPPGYGYGYGHGAYGYGAYGYGGTRTIVETTVETGASHVVEEVIEERVVVHRPRRVVRRAPPPRRPIRGERG